jgi:FMN phosphatase YigB (HAD superfamily)
MDTKLNSKKLNQSLILVDADGVLLDWAGRFDEWMISHGYQLQDANAYLIDDRFDVSFNMGRACIKQFNESAAIGYLNPLRDAQAYVRQLHEQHGYTFHLITSLGQDAYAAMARELNIKTLFGDTAFSRFVFLDTGADKHEALAEYRDSGCWWVEDKVENAEVGLEFGLRSVLMAHGYNQDYKNPRIPVVHDWQGFYRMVTELVIDHTVPVLSL